MDSAHRTQIIGRRKRKLLVLKTRFNDGSAFETSNLASAELFEPNPKFPTFRFPQIASTADLYRVDCEIRAEFTTTRLAVLSEKEGELAEDIGAAERVHQWNLSQTDFKLAESGDRYAYSLKGAIRHAWLGTWPVRPLREMRVRKDASAKLRELGFNVDPKSGLIFSRNTPTPNA